MRSKKKFNPRNASALVGASIIIPLQIGYPFFPDWFRPRILPVTILVFGVCAALVLLYNRLTYGVYLPGPPKE